MNNENGCEYCYIPSDDYSYSWVAEKSIPLDVKGYKKCIENVEAGIHDNPEAESMQIFITSVNWDVEFNINFCPMCGRRI